MDWPTIVPVNNQSEVDKIERDAFRMKYARAMERAFKSERPPSFLTESCVLYALFERCAEVDSQNWGTEQKMADDISVMLPKQ